MICSVSTDGDITYTWSWRKICFLIRSFMINEQNGWLPIVSGVIYMCMMINIHNYQIALLRDCLLVVHNGWEEMSKGYHTCMYHVQYTLLVIMHMHRVFEKLEQQYGYHIRTVPVGLVFPFHDRDQDSHSLKLCIVFCHRSSKTGLHLRISSGRFLARYSGWHLTEALPSSSWFLCEASLCCFQHPSEF